ncbi:MAG: ACT domain-containing protein [Inconstantimicrobium porci]|uniref:UPF0237 protein FYJ33_07410 n=1 Tax=Inconstantimicrobium porci TaxID=2652291 RepID=A0A7X2MY62_9CLOT|nr:ACT domain-containing protein [Inconstantimicrobium porci]MDY5913089.1 ACT domain-containing protein [Inconstantimicrobium porci]MSR91243.1 ACT domain-containing protein [Inconstantimicrobium porci]
MKCVLTVVGKDRVGIIYEVTKVLAKERINVLDISQTIVSGYFTMIMITDLSGCDKTIEEIREELNVLGTKIGMEVRIQHEDIFNAMHTIG